jgi:hypothetical protein
MTATQLKQQLNDVQYTTEQLKEKLTNRKVWKGRDGWEAKTTAKDIKGHDWEILTFKAGSGCLVTMAQAGTLKEENGYTSFSFEVFGSPRIKLNEVRERCTEKIINDLHTKGLSKFVNELELNSFKPTHN